MYAAINRSIHSAFASFCTCKFIRIIFTIEIGEKFGHKKENTMNKKYILLRIESTISYATCSLSARTFSVKQKIHLPLQKKKCVSKQSRVVNYGYRIYLLK